MQKLSLSRYSITREISEYLLDNQATAKDFSIGGMRVEASAPISINQVISFEFDENVKPGGYKSKGEVRWINQNHPEGLTMRRQGLC